MTDWKAYYPDGRTIGSDEADWSEVDDGLVCVVIYYDPPYRKVMSHADYYWRNADGTFGCSGTPKKWGTWKSTDVIPDDAEAVWSCERLTDDRFKTIYDEAMKRD